MTITVERGDLVNALGTVSRIVENRNTYPILANVHLSTDGGRLNVRGTDLDIQVTTSIPATGELAPITAPAKMLLEIVKKFPAGAEVSIDLENETLIVKSGRSRFRLGTLSAASFPDIKSETYEVEFNVDLEALVAQVRFAISNDTNRYHLNGVYLHGSPSALTAVATDGHRLAKHVESGTWLEFDAVILPTKFVGILPQGSIKLAVNRTKVRVQYEDTTIVSKLIEGTFPDFERVIPRQNGRMVVAKRSELASAFERVSTITERGKGVRFEAENGAIRLSVSAEKDGATDEVATPYNGDKIESGMNAAYFREILSAAGGDEVTLAFGDELGPILVKGGNENWVGVQMPMRA